MEQHFKKITYSLIFGIIVYFIIFLIGDYKQIINAFLDFNIIYLPFILLCSLINYFLRYQRWKKYLSLTGLKISKSKQVFLSSLSMAVTPMKIGEFLKSFLIKKHDNIDKSLTSPIVLMERFGDVVGLLLLSFIGLVGFFELQSMYYLIGILFFILLGLIFVKTRFFMIILKKIFSRWTDISKIENFNQTMKKLMSPKNIYYTIFISSFSWFFEGIGFFLVMKGFGFELTVLQSIFIFLFSNLIGSLSFIPGGFGITEGSLSILLMKLMIPTQIAISASLMIRITTLWFGVFIGLYYLKRLI